MRPSKRERTSGGPLDPTVGPAFKLRSNLSRLKVPQKLSKKISIDLVFYIEFNGVIGSTILRRFLTNILHNGRKEL